MLSLNSDNGFTIQLFYHKVQRFKSISSLGQSRTDPGVPEKNLTQYQRNLINKQKYGFWMALKLQIPTK